MTSYHKIAVKSIVSIVGPKVQQALRKVFDSINSTRKGKEVMVSKLTVSFDENTDRLVTFQSEIPRDLSIIDYHKISIIEKEK
jgi:hypothetical protein